MKLALKDFMFNVKTRVDTAASALIDSEDSSDEIKKAYLRGKLDAELEYQSILKDFFKVFTVVKRNYKSKKLV